MMELIKRMYVYRCGKTLELAIAADDKEKNKILKEKISKYICSYINSNIEHLDRIKWIEDLMLY